MPLPQQVFHLIEEANWPSIRERGLVPARVLLGEAFPNDKDITSAHRPRHIVLPTGVHIRDQAPMPEGALAKALVDMTPAQWYELINDHVFFWLDSERLNRQLAACRSRSQLVATIQTSALISRHGKDAYVTPFNVGYALRKPARRGRGTLVPHRIWEQSGWAFETRDTGKPPRSQRHPPAELLIRGPIPEFLQIACNVVRIAPGERFFPSAA